MLIITRNLAGLVAVAKIRLGVIKQHEYEQDLHSQRDEGNRCCANAVSDFHWGNLLKSLKFGGICA
jgi:hypothetical protein